MIERYFSVGPNDWNFINSLPTANVSPFMFTFSAIALFLPKKIRGYVFSLISLLSFGMLMACELSIITYIIRNYTFHYFIFLDFVIHILMSLVGIYFGITNISKLDKKSCLIASSIIYVVAIIMLILNLIFATSFFGLNLYGNHSIYNVVLVQSGILSAIIYFTGLTLVLLLGFLYQKLLRKLKKTDK